MPFDSPQDQFNLMYYFCPYDIDAISDEIDSCALDHIPRMVVGDDGKLCAVIMVEDGMVMLYSDDDLLMDSMEGLFAN